MEDIRSLQPMQLDALREVTNMGAGHAATALSQMTGGTILISVPRINIQRLEEPGRPDLRQSNRGPATGLRVAIPVLNIHKTRLNDPFTWYMGTNDQPGDYRQSGCAGCHEIYANDREPRHSLNYGKCGRDGQTITRDPTINALREGQHRSGAYGTCNNMGICKPVAANNCTR